MAKARNLKRAGDLIGAVSAMDAALELDGQDRFLNTKCATYHLRIGEINEAQKLFGLFTKKDVLTPAKDLEDMQSYKFLLEDGEAHMRVGKLAMALKRFRSVDRVSSPTTVHHWANLWNRFSWICMKTSLTSIHTVSESLQSTSTWSM